jgi:AraC family transcriptional regulator, transcriptional activator for feuABC-ybbA operon
MKSIYLKSGKTQEVFNELRDTVKGTLVSENGEQNLSFHSDFAKGNIKAISFPGGITYVHFDLIFRDEVMLSLEPINNSPIFFAYCSEGSLKYSIGTLGDKKSLKESQTGILKNTARINSILYFEKNVPLKFSIIKIETNIMGDGVNDAFIKKLKSTFFREKEDLMHVRLQNFKISEKIEELNTITQKGIGRSLLKKEILKNILAMEIEQHNDSFAKMSDAITILALKQFDEIKRVSDYIINLSAEVFSLKYFKKNAVAVHNNIKYIKI